GREPAVDAAFRPFGPGGAYGRLALCEMAEEMDRVAPGVHEGAAGELGAPADVIGAEQRDAERRLQSLDLPDLAGGHDRPKPAEKWVIAIVERLHQHAARAGGGGGHGLGLGD